MKQEKIHDRTSADLTLGSVISIAIVPDPYEKGQYLQVTRSIRDDPLAGMLSRNQINEAQFQAGRKWQSLHEKSTIGAIRAIDPAKEAVDGGTMREFLTDSQVMAFRELSESYKALNKVATHLGRLIFDILARVHTISSAAQFYGWHPRRVGLEFRTGLETLAVHYKFSSPKYENGLAPPTVNQLHSAR